MTDYNPPLKDILFSIHELSGLTDVLKLNDFSETTADVVDQVFNEAGKFARDVWAPLNIPGDRVGCQVVDKEVSVPPGFADAYQQFVESGWQTLAVPPQYGGMGLPGVVAAAVAEMLQSANLAFALCPMLTSGAVSAIDAHASDELKQKYLPKLASGEWTGTMVLTEPQAGSDLAAITTKAVPDGDHYRITGTKIYITWGDQPFSENVIHLVIARLSDAPDGVRGISLFLVPKYLVDDNGAVGKRNDVYPVSVEHKLGIHASPTCVMNFGDDDGAVAYLIGEENRGLACMFTMMNHARVDVGIQGLAISERAYQLARAYALERVQGKAQEKKGRVTIVHHPDVRRMLMLMKAQIEAMRITAYVTAAIVDVAHHNSEDSVRSDASARAALLTPIMKAWMTEVAQEVTSLGVQIHGGMGFVEETGAAQYVRDARILTIYEGTTGIQANDLVGRKLLFDEGKALFTLIEEMRSLDASLALQPQLAAIQAALAVAVADLHKASVWLIKQSATDRHAAGAAAVNLLMLAGTVVGGWQMARAALIAQRKITENADDRDYFSAKIVTAKFYAEHILPRSSAYCDAAMAGSDSMMAMSERWF